MELFKLFGTLALKGTDEAERDLRDVTDTAEKSSSKLTSAFKKIGTAVAAAFAVDKIKDFGVAIVNASAEVAAEEAAFTQIMGTYSDEAAKKVSKIAESTGMVDSRLTPYMTSMTAKFKGLGYDIDDATDLASTGLTIAADAAAFWDKSIDDSMSSLNSFVNGNYEGGEAIGLFANETTLAKWASDNLGLTWKDLTEKEKQFARLQFAKAMQEASGAAGQASKESGAYQNVMGNLTEAWRQFKAQAGEPILQKIVIPAMKWLGDFITNTLSPRLDELKTKVSDFYNNVLKPKIEEAKVKFEEFKAKLVELKTAYEENKNVIQTVIGVMGALGAAILTYNTYMKHAQTITNLVKIAQSVWSVITGVLTGQITLQTIAQKALNKAMLMNPIGLIIAAIAGLIAIFVVAYKKNEDFRNAVNNLWKEIKKGLAPVIEALKPLLSAMINLFKGIWSIISAVVIPIIKLFVSRITAMVQIITPILSVLLKVFNAVFQPVVKIVTNVINVIGKIASAIGGAVKAVTTGIGKIKDLFKFKWSLPKLKVPKFSISPDGWKVGDLLKGIKPKLSVKWMAEGGIFDEPTLFNTRSGAVGVGEAGKEAVAPIDKLQGYVRTAVQSETNGLGEKIDKLIELLAKFFPEILENLDMDIVLNDGVLVGRLAPKMNAKFGDIAKANARGR